MDKIFYELSFLFPALAFLLTGVPLALLLDKLGFFRSAASILLSKHPSVFTLWVLAAVTTAILNLDTTIVLLTPLYLQIARQTKSDPLPLLVIPLLLASFASSLLPISNLTNLILVGKFNIAAKDFLFYLGLPTIAATMSAWFFYKKRFPENLTLVPLEKHFDHKAFTIGCIILIYLLIGFTFGMEAGLQPWLIVLFADIVLICITRSFSWEWIPLKTTILVTAIAGVAISLIPSEFLKQLFLVPNTLVQMTGAVLLSTLGTNTINNLPTTIMGVTSTSSVTWGTWAWVIGVNVGAVLLPIGALANLLWIGIIKHSHIPLSFRQYLSITLPIGLPTLLIAFLVLVGEYLLTS